MFAWRFTELREAAERTVNGIRDPNARQLALAKRKTLPESLDNRLGEVNLVVAILHGVLSAA